MNSIKILILFITLLPFLSCTSYKIKHISSEDSKPQKGIHYSLPQTVIVVDLYIEKQTYLPGPYAKYAGQFLDLKNVIREQETIYTIKETKFNSYIEPDPNYYYVLSKKDFLSNKSTNINLTESGILIGINSGCIDDSSFTIDNTIRTAGNFVDFKKIAFSDNLKTRIDTSFQIVKREPFSYKRTIIEKSIERKSVEDQAQEASKQIIDINKKRYELITAKKKRDIDVNTLNLMLDELNNLEKDYMNLFTGIVNKEVTKYRYYITPQKNGNPESELCKFSPTIGVSDTSLTVGNPVLIKFHKFNNTQLVSENKQKKDLNGICYRIPENTIITINYNSKEFASQKFMISQFGKVSQLPFKMLKPKPSIKFYKNSGAIQFIKL